LLVHKEEEPPHSSARALPARVLPLGLREVLESSGGSAALAFAFPFAHALALALALAGLVVQHLNLVILFLFLR